VTVRTEEEAHSSPAHTDPISNQPAVPAVPPTQSSACDRDKGVIRTVLRIVMAQVGVLRCCCCPCPLSHREDPVKVVEQPVPPGLPLPLVTLGLTHRHRIKQTRNNSTWGGHTTGGRRDSGFMLCPAASRCDVLSSPVLCHIVLCRVGNAIWAANTSSH